MSNQTLAVAPDPHSSQDTPAVVDATVTITDSTLHIRELSTSGPAFAAVAEAVARQENAEVLVHRILDLGGALIQHRGSQATVEAVGSEVNRFIDAVAAAAGEQLPETMKQFTEQIGDVLGEHFAGDKSVQNQLLGMIQKASVEQRQEFVRALIADGGPLGVLAAQLREISRKEDELTRQLTAVSERLAAKERLAVEYDRGAAKGIDYQVLVHSAVDAIVAPYEDVADFTGDTLGTDKNKKGDTVIVLDKRWTHGHDLRVVVEAKDDDMSMNMALKEIDAAISNREAAAGVMCFASPAKAPTGVRALRMCGAGRIVCIYDREERNPLALECAIHVARAVAVASIDTQPDGLDSARIGDAIERIIEIIEAAKTIRRGSNAAHKGLIAIDSAYEKLRDDALAVVDELRDAIAS